MLNALFYLCIAVLSLGQFSSIYKSGEANIYLFDIVVGLFSFAGLIFFLIQKKLEIPKKLIPFLVFTFISLVALLVNLYWLEGMQILTSAFYWIRWVLYLIAAIIAYNLLLNKKIETKSILKAFLVSGVFLSLVGFIQLVVLPDFEKLDPSLGWDPHKNRLASTFFDPNFVGGYLNICFILGIAALQQKFVSKKFVITSIAIILAAIFLTFSRSAWAMSAIIIFVYGAFKYRKLLIVAAVLAILTYAAIPRVQSRISGVTDPADSAHFRIISWQNAYKIAQNNLLIGVGFNTFRYAQQEYGNFEVGETGGNSGAGTDSSFLLVLATTGIFGLLSFLIGYFAPITQKQNIFYLPVVAAFCGLFIQSQFINALFYPQILFGWLVLLSIFSYFSSRT